MNLLPKYSVEKEILLITLDSELIKEEPLKLEELVETHSVIMLMLDNTLVLSILELVAMFTQLMVPHNQFLKLVSKLEVSEHLHNHKQDSEHMQHNHKQEDLEHIPNHKLEDLEHLLHHLHIKLTTNLVLIVMIMHK